MNDSRSVENEIIQLMLYREAFLPLGPSAEELYGPLLRKIEALDQRLADAHFRTFVDSDVRTPKVLVTISALSSCLA